MVLGSMRKEVEAETIIKLNRNGTVSVIKDRLGGLAAEIHRTAKGRYLVLNREA